MKQQIIAYTRVIVALIATMLLAQLAPSLFAFFEHGAEAELLRTFFLISILFVLSFASFYLPASTALPSFVVAIFFGMVAQPLLAPVVQEHAVLNALVGLGATLILFGGGLETPFRNFKKLFWKILSLSFPGLFLTAFLFSLAVVFIALLLGAQVSIVVGVLLGAILASTDPASIIPILKQLRFQNRDTKDIIVSESAMTDVTGTLLTVAFVTTLAAGGLMTSVVAGYHSLLTTETGVFLFKQIAFGAVFGGTGFLLLELLTRFKKRHEQEFEVDAAYFFFVPILMFVLTLALGGSGYLAAFVVGLLFILTEHLQETAKFFNHMIDGFLKPTVFLLLGALVDVASLWEYAVIGILVAFLFMFVIRPIAVFLTLGPFSLFQRTGSNQFTVRELMFISFVRETGAIPAVLLITIVGSGIHGLDGLLPIGMWVILVTLILQPPLTPVVARFLGVANDIQDDQALQLRQQEPVVVLGSRGNSYKRRLPFVVSWAVKHHVKRVILLHCLEDKYTRELAARIGKEAMKAFTALNKERTQSGQSELEFQYISRRGFLHDSIRDIANDENVAVIFVGKKALDYQLSEYRQMPVPFYFLA